MYFLAHRNIVAKSPGDVECRGIRPPQTSVLDMALSNLIVTPLILDLWGM